MLTWLGVLAGLFAVLSASFRFADRAAERASEQAAHELRLRLTRRVLDPHGGAEAGRLPGALVNIATGDVKRVGILAMAVPFGVAALVALVISAVILLRISVPLGLLVLVGTPPVLWLTHVVGKPLERRSDSEQDRAAHASGVATDLVAGLRVLKGIRAESAAVDRYRRTSQESRTAAVHATRAHGWHDGAVLTVIGMFLGVVALLGAYLALKGTISVGELVAAVGLAQFLLTPFMSLPGSTAHTHRDGRRQAESPRCSPRLPPSRPGRSASPMRPADASGRPASPTARSAAWISTSPPAASSVSPYPIPRRRSISSPCWPGTLIRNEEPSRWTAFRCPLWR